MSDFDDLSTPDSIPPDSVIESILRRVVHLANKSNETLTVNVARSRAEQELDLPSAFFKNHPVWKSKSRDIITEAVNDPNSPEKPVTNKTVKAGAKRKSADAQAPRKKPKISHSKAQESHKLSVDAIVDSDDEESGLPDPPKDVPDKPAPAPRDDPIQDDESDLSSVIDDPPPRKRRTKKSTSPSAAKSQPKKSGKSSKAATTEKATSKEPDKAKELGPDEEEIKRLQSWLLKCGVRKLWHREFAPYSTPKEKIRHLKKMLDDIGMTGRFSAEKAKQIKETRELKAELEAVEEFNDKWGHESAGSGSEAEEETKKSEIPKRRRPKGLVDFGDSDEDSE